jgi:hypothetical protein
VRLPAGPVGLRLDGGGPIRSYGRPACFDRMGCGDPLTIRRRDAIRLADIAYMLLVNGSPASRLLPRC